MTEEETSSSINYTFKYIIIGETFVGKSNIILHYIKGEFKENYNVTIGLEVGFKEIKKNDKFYKLQIWDTAGQEKYRSVTRGFYKNSVCGFVVYDITKKETFKRVIPWIEECKSNSSKQITIILLGNKADLTYERQVSYEEGKNLAEKYGIEFFETSAKTGQNINEAFDKSVNMIIDNINNDVYDLDDEQCGIKIGEQKLGTKIQLPVSNEENKENIEKKNKKKCCK